MSDFFGDYIGFVTGLTPGRFMRLFWYYFIFDFSRYILWELVILIRAVLLRDSREPLREKARQRLYREQPLVSVIVPGKNEGRHIGDLSRSLRSQSWKNIEIIIVDDGSDDNTAYICRQLEHQGDIDMFIRNEVRGGKASAANTALRYVRGHYVIHLDADSHLYVDAIECMLIQFYMDERIGGIGGDLYVSNQNESLATSLQAIEYAKSISVGRQVSSSLGILRIISGAFGAFKTDALKRIKGWDVGPGLDGDITLKLRKLGYMVAFEPRAICFTNVPASFRALAKQRYRWDRSLVRFRLRKHADLFIANANFNFSNLLTVADNMFYNVVLNINWMIYFSDMIATQSSVIWHIIITNYILYIFSNIVQYTVALLLAPNKVIRFAEMRLYLFLPLVPLYMGIYLRIVRTLAYVGELLWRRSYEDAWNPWKVSKEVLSHKT